MVGSKGGELFIQGPKCRRSSGHIKDIGSYEDIEEPWEDFNQAAT